MHVCTCFKKRVRFTTSVLFVGSIGLELLTPTFPRFFLLLATIANIAKQISLACYLATRSAVHQSFAKADNLGEISAKAQIQTVCFDILGLMLAALVNMWIGNHQRPQAGLHFFVYPLFAFMDLFGIYQGLKHVHLKTLTKDRLEIILKTWIEFGYVPSPADVSEKEVINFMGVKGKSLWPVRIGCISPKDQIPEWSMKTIQSITDEDYYFVCMEIFEGLKRTGQLRILLSIREGAESKHIIMGLLQVIRLFFLMIFQLLLSILLLMLLLLLANLNPLMFLLSMSYHVGERHKVPGLNNLSANCITVCISRLHNKR